MNTTEFSNASTTPEPASIVGVLSPQRTETLRTYTGDRRFYVLDIDGTPILFRIDGLVVGLTPITRDLLVPAGNSIEAHVAELVALYGAPAVTAAIDDLGILLDNGVRPDGVPDELPFERATTVSGVLIMVTQTCNLACLYCYADAGTYRQPTKFQKADQVEHAIDNLVASSGNKTSLTVTFFGGEPLLSFDLVERTVAYCQQLTATTGKTFKYSITTNGTLVSETIAAFMAAHRFNVMVSFDGQKTFQDKYRPHADGHGSYDEVTGGIRRLIAAGVPLMLRGTVVREMVNMAAIKNTAAEAKRLGVKRLALTAVDCSQTVSAAYALGANEVDALAAIYNEITEENLANGMDSPFDPHARMIGALTTGTAVGMGRCGACRGTAAVSTDGRMYPCHRFVGMDDYIIGSVADGGLDNGKVNAFFDKAHDAYHPKCSECMARLICGGLCFYTCADGHGGFNTPPEVACDNFRRSLKESIGYMLRLREMPPEQGQRYLRAATA